MNNDNIVGWFSTESGTHIPIKKGQSKKEAIAERFNNADDMRKSGYVIFPDKIYKTSLSNYEREKIKEIDKEIPVKSLTKYDIESQNKHDEDYIKNTEAKLKVYDEVSRQYKLDADKITDKVLKDRVLKQSKWYEDFSNSQKPLLETVRKNIEFRNNLGK